MQENNTAGYKHTPIGLLPTDWIVDIIENLGQVKRGAGSQYLNYLENDGIRFIRINDFFENNPVYVEATKAILRFCIEDNDILFAGTGASAGASYIPKKEWLGLPHSYNAPRIRVNSNQNRQFILYSLQSDYIAKQQKELFVGAAQPFLDTTAIANFIIAIPPLPEQQKIATILSTWDAAIDNCKAIIDNLKQRNKGLAQQLLTGKIRVKGFEKAKWHFFPIHKIAKEISLKNPSDKELIVMSCTKYDGLVPSLEYFGRKIYSDDLTTYKIVKKGQFAYATNHIEEGSIGYQSKFDEALISPMYTVFQTDDTINDNLLFKILKSHEYIHQYQKRMEGSIDRRGGLRWDEFSKIKVPVIDLEEQNAIVDILDAATLELNQYQQQLQTLQQQKKGLMQQLLTGRVRVKI